MKTSGKGRKLTQAIVRNCANIGDVAVGTRDRSLSLDLEVVGRASLRKGSLSRPKKPRSNLCRASREIKEIEVGGGAQMQGQGFSRNWKAYVAKAQMQ